VITFQFGKFSIVSQLPSAKRREGSVGNEKAARPPPHRSFQDFVLRSSRPPTEKVTTGILIKRPPNPHGIIEILEVKAGYGKALIEKGDNDAVQNKIHRED
jgi:hypothetical protein